MTKNAVAKAWTYHEWSTGETKSWAEPTGTALSQAAAALSAGDSAAFDSTTTGDDVPWANQYQIQQSCCQFHYSPTLRIARVLGKPASGQVGDASLNFTLYTYDEDSNNWSLDATDDFGSSSNNGHAWNVAMDPATGDLYMIVQGQSIMRIFTNGAWTTSSDEGGTLLNNLGVSSHGGMGWHPNLCGAGDGGVVVRSIDYAAGWRNSTDTWHQIAGPYGNPNDNRDHAGGGSSVYFPATDTLTLGTGDDQGQSGGRTPLQIFNAGSSGSVDTSPATSTNDPPVIIAGVAGTSNYAHMVVDPRDATAILMLERLSPYRVWRSTDQGDSWSQETGVAHPFTNNPHFTIVSIPDYGVIWGISSGASGTAFSILFKPPAL